MHNARKSAGFNSLSRSRSLNCERLEERLVLSTVPLTDLPLLSSDPNSTNKIFLDFDGHVTSGTSWNRIYYGDNDIHSKAYDVDGDETTFNEQELAEIVKAWEVVVEDFAPFDVDITTIEPPPNAFSAGSEAIRVLFSDNDDDSSLGGTGNQWFNVFANGVAFFNSWTWTSDTPVWVFSSGNLGNVASHELGHAFDLRHDGPGVNGPYNGHDVPGLEYLWKPIMGLALGTPSPDREIYQWSKGEYTDATNSQDDVAIITAALGLRADDHGDTPGSASSSSVLSFVGDTLSGSGIIETRTDIDSFRFTVTQSEDLYLEATPHPFAPNLDIELKLFDDSGTLLLTSSPDESLSASIQAVLAPGDYYVSIDGVGINTPDDGYSDYGSLGQYWIDGRMNDVPVVIRVNELPDQNKRIKVSFSEDLSASLDPSDLQIVSSGGNQIDLSAAVLDPVNGVWDLASVLLPSDDYTATLVASGITDISGNLLDGDGDGLPGGDYTFSFNDYREPGDVNLDGSVDALDFDIIQTNFELLGLDVSWEDGDLDGDMYVGTADLGIWISNVPGVITPTITGDFTGDGIVSARDIDILYRAVNTVSGAGAQAALYNGWLSIAYDLNDDGNVDQADIDELIFGVLGTNYGDADLDGDVDGDDLMTVQLNWGEIGGWAIGDFNGDGFVDGSDLITVQVNWG